MNIYGVMWKKPIVENDMRRCGRYGNERFILVVYQMVSLKVNEYPNVDIRDPLS